MIGAAALTLLGGLMLALARQRRSTVG
ncbi:hypothetical protein [Georgenia sp. SUBG003]